MEHEEYIPPTDTPARLHRRAAAVAALRNISPPSKRVKFTPALASKIVAFAKQNRPRALTFEEKLDTLLLQRHFRQEHLARMIKDGKKRYRNRKSPDYSKKVASILFRDNKLVANTWREFVTAQKITLSEPPGNRKPKAKYVPDTRKVLSTLRKFMRERREIRKRTVANDLLNCLLENGLCGVHGRGCGT